MGVRANWFLDEVPAAIDDPFVGAVAPAVLPPVEERIEDVGVPIDLSNPDAILAEVSDLISEEGRLWEQGVTCGVRDRTDTSCCACPFSHHAEQDHRLQRLCDLGRKMERAFTTHAHLVAMKREAGGE